MGLLQCPDCKRDISDSAATCIHCGRPMKSADTLRRPEQPIQPAPTVPGPQCLKCGSTNLKKYSLISEENRSTISLGTVGVSVSQGGGIGIGGAKTSGTQISDLARRVAPPNQKAFSSVNEVGIVVLALGFGALGYFTFGIGGAILAMIVGGVGSGIVLAIHEAPDVRAQYAYAFDLWDRKFMCMQCGATILKGAKGFTLESSDPEVDLLIRAGKKIQAATLLTQRTKQPLNEALAAVEERRLELG